MRVSCGRRVREPGQGLKGLIALLLPGHFTPPLFYAALRGQTTRFVREQVVRGDVFEMEEGVDNLGGTRKMRTGNAEKEDFMGRPKVVLYVGTVISPG